MAETVLDEELTEGLKQAKKAPRNFALIAKGATPVKLLVQKKKFREGELMKAKAEAKGNDVITGVLQASGSDFAFLIVGEEPSVKALKLKDFIGEQTDVVAKPRWEIVTTLPEVDEADDKPTTPTADDLHKRIADALKALGPAMQKALTVQPTRKDEIVAAAAEVKALLAAEKLGEAQAALEKLGELVQSVSPAAQDGKVSLTQLGKARLEWLSVRDQALADIRRLKDAIAQEFRDDASQAKELAAALKTLDGAIRQLESRLHEELDAVLNAPEAGRPPLIVAARKTLGSLMSFLETDSVMGAIDGNEVVPSMAVAAPLRAKLTQISAALG